VWGGVEKYIKIYVPGLGKLIAQAGFYARN